jgi:hypothetical protein
LVLKSLGRKPEGSETEVSSRTLRLSCSSIPLFRFRAEPAAIGGSQKEFRKCSSYRPCR